MKRILLASTAIVAFAGAAAADVSLSGEASLGYNDNANGDNDGFYSDVSVSLGLSQELDNGVTAAVSTDLADLAGNTTGLEDLEFSLTTDSAGLYYGDTAFAAETRFSAVGDMDIGAAEADGEEVLRGDMTFGAWGVSISQDITNDALSIGASGDLGDASVALFNEGDNTGLTAGMSLGGADVTVGFATDGTDNSTGLAVSYPMGATTLSADYAQLSDGTNSWNVGVDYADGPVSVSASYDGTDENFAVEGSYNVGNGMTVYAGLLNNGDDNYVGVSYDLGGGASLLASVATDDDQSQGDEVGANDYQEGMTIELSFAF